MANKSDDAPIEDKVEDKPVEEPKEQPADEPKVELDQRVDVEGTLTENPVADEAPVEEGSGEESPEPKEPEATPGEGEEAKPEGETKTGTAKEVGSKTPVLEVEPDEAGVYSDVVVEDPGDFKPGDHSFTVTIDGKRQKVSSLDEADALVEQITDAKQLVRFMDKRADMREAFKKDEADFQARKDEFERNKAQVEVREQTLTQWNNEINYLQSKGLLPEITDKANADWLGNSEDPAVKARMEVFNWMQKENEARKAAGIPEETSLVSAYHQMQAEKTESAAEAANKEDKRLRQSRGAMVGGNAPFEPEGEQKPGSITGTGGSLRELMNEISVAQ